MTDPQQTARHTVICADWIVPVRPAREVLEGHAVVIEGESIVAILPAAEALDAFSSAHVVDLPGHVLIPGLINAHGHAAMTLLRGYSDDQTLMTWLTDHIWPVEAAMIDYEFVHDGTTLAVAEMISSGTTFAADTYFFPDAVANAFIEQGFRGQVCLPVVRFGNAWASDEADHIHKGLTFRDDFKHQPLLTTAFAPHAPYTVSDDGLARILVLSEELEIPIHLHLHETASEVADARRKDGESPVERLARLNLLSPLLQAVHMTQLDDTAMDLIANYGVQIAHCPESNMKLASGICPVTALASRNVNVALGTDGAASNNNLDMLGEMHTASLLAKVDQDDATALDAFAALEMATINGARFFGLEDRIGSIEVGKAADLAAIDLDSPGLMPVYNPVSQLVYAASGNDVTNVWIAGQQLLDDGRLTRLDLHDLREKTRHWQSRIKEYSA